MLRQLMPAFYETRLSAREQDAWHAWLQAWHARLRVSRGGGGGGDGDEDGDEAEAGMAAAAREMEAVGAWRLPA